MRANFNLATLKLNNFGIFIVVLFVCVSPVALIAQASCPETTGTISREAYTSSILREKMIYSIYLPPCYAVTNQKYPVIYLMHGSNDDDQQWQRLGLLDVLDEGIASGKYPPLIVIMPFGDWVANEARFDGTGWADVFEQDVMPRVESTYRIDKRSESRAIGGISRGAFWAFSISLRHPDWFSAIGGHSAFLEAGGVTPEYDPYALIISAPVTSMRFWMDRGAQDFAAPTMDRMDALLRERGLNIEYVIQPQGEHNNIYWSAHVGKYLDFYTQAWSKASNVPADNIFVTATPRPTPIAAPREGVMVFVPAVLFQSLRTSLSIKKLQSLLGGEPDPQLILDGNTATLLLNKGVRLSVNTRVVSPEMLQTALSADRALYTILPFDKLTPHYRILWLDDVHPLDHLDTYPLVFVSDTPNYDPGKLTRITLSGVTALTRQTRAALDQNGIEWAGEGILPYVTKSDFFHISNEVSFYSTCPQTSGPTLGGASSFCAKPEHFDLQKFLDVDIVELSGNHNNDYGYDAYLDTLQFYGDNGMLTVGGGENVEEAQKPLFVEHNASHIAMLSCNAIGPYYALANDDPNLAGGIRPGAAPCDWVWLENTLPRLASQSDLVIVSVQHQEFEEYTPTETQRYDFRRLADLGADVVIGTAPHKPQTFEFYATQRGEEAFLHYGLGNLFFDQPFWGNMRFFMDTVYIYDGKFLTVDLFPGIIDDFARPRLMTPAERENFLYFMFVEQNGF